MDMAHKTKAWAVAQFSSKTSWEVSPSFCLNMSYVLWPGLGCRLSFLYRCNADFFLSKVGCERAR